MKGINLFWLLGIALLEIVISITLSITLSVIHCKDETRKKWTRIHHAICWIITICFIIWRLINIDVIKISSFPVFIMSGLMIITSLVYVYIDREYPLITIIFVQIVMCFFLAKIAPYDIKYSQELIEITEIKYCDSENVITLSSDKGSYYAGEPIRYYYFIQNSDSKEYCYTTKEYDIEIYHDVELEETEYYEMYSQKSYTILSGLGAYYQNAENEFKVVFHVHK